MEKWLQIAAAMLILSGCATESGGAGGSTDWRKAGSTAEQTSAAKALCQGKAEEVFPVNPQMLSVGWDTPPRRECIPGPNGPTCTNVPGTPAPPKMLDANEASRKKGFEACMKALGWSR